MRFGWDPSKSARNSRERGLPFEVAMALFDGPTLEFNDRRWSYGEERIVAFGAVAGRVLVCVYTWRGTANDRIRRIISLRPANRDERNAYHNAFPQ